MTTTTANLFTRDDTFFGICEGIGEDTGINANLIRIAFAVAVMWNPLVIVGIYLALGAILFGTRRLFPVRRRAATVSPEAAPIVADNDAAPAPVHARAA